MRKNKRGIFFSTDALIALVIIILSISVIYPIIKYSQKESYVPEDIITSLSALKIGEINNGYVDGLKTQDKITPEDYNKSVLEMIGEFYVSDETKLMAEELARQVLSTIDLKENIGIWYNGDLLASKATMNIDDAKNVNVERQVISGIKYGESLTGYSARAFLKNSVQTKYFYLGGYVGEGNITLNIEYNGTLTRMDLEITANTNFTIYINEKPTYGFFQPAASDLEPKNFSDLGYTGPDYFHPGLNHLKFVPIDSTKKLHVAGGYIKITYSDGIQYERPVRYYLPGIEGVINLYDGFYIPGNLQNLNAHLHFKSGLLKVFLNIGGKTIYSGNSSGSPTIELTDSDFSSLNYNSLSYKTIPLRFGIENGSYISSDTKKADVFSVYGVPGSINEQVPPPYNKMEDLEMAANQAFIDIMLETTGNRVGLSQYKGQQTDPLYHPLSNDTDSLNEVLDDLKAGQGSCVCCGINKAVTGLATESDNSKYRAMVIFTDDKMQGKCSQQGTGSAYEDAKKAALDACTNYNISVYVIGMGSDDGAKLQAMTACGGIYVHATVSNLIDIYIDIARHIIQAVYDEQIVTLTGNYNTTLYPDSYIEFNYTKDAFSDGLIIKGEQNFADNKHGVFSLPENSSIVEANIISYSGVKWTQYVFANNTIVYNLSSYGSNYTNLGDPYLINIPNSYIGKNNIINATTGLNPRNSSFGNEKNKIIYTVVKKTDSYSPITSYAKGCVWNIEFEYGSPLVISIPDGAQEDCYYKPDCISDSSICYSTNDASQTAIYNLLKKLDLDNPPNGKIDLRFDEQNLQVVSSEITGIPFTWETEIKVMKWW